MGRRGSGDPHQEWSSLHVALSNRVRLATVPGPFRQFNLGHLRSFRFEVQCLLLNSYIRDSRRSCGTVISTATRLPRTVSLLPFACPASGGIGTNPCRSPNFEAASHCLYSSVIARTGDSQPGKPAPAIWLSRPRSWLPAGDGGISGVAASFKHHIDSRARGRYRGGRLWFRWSVWSEGC